MSAADELIDVAYAVCTGLDRIGERALLVGGSAATFYAPEAYTSLDCDFILSFDAEPSSVTAALGALGFKRTNDGYFASSRSLITVEFPSGPASIGTEEVASWATHRRNGEVLHVYTPTDVVRDRFMHYWAWNDRQALRVALDVARVEAEHIDLDAIVAWSAREIAAGPAWHDRTRRDLFVAELRTIVRG